MKESAEKELQTVQGFVILLEQKKNMRGKEIEDVDKLVKNHFNLLSKEDIELKSSEVYLVARCVEAMIKLRSVMEESSMDVSDVSFCIRKKLMFLTTPEIEELYVACILLPIS